MAVEVTSFKWAWKLIAWLPSFVFKKVFTKEWFQKQVKIDLRARHEPVTLWAGDKKEIQIWLAVVNLTYFDIELDRLIVQFNSAGHQVTLTKLDREDIQSLSVKDNLVLRSNLTLDHVLAIQRNFDQGKGAYIEIHAEFNSKVHNFKIDKTLDGVLPVCYNF